MTQLLEIKDLKTRFYTDEGVVHAVNGISYDMEVGETLGIVGESGCGKSVHALSIMRLIPSPPGKIVAGEIIGLPPVCDHIRECGRADALCLRTESGLVRRRVRR